MKAYQKERLENAVCFFAREHYKKTKTFAWQTHIYKYLAFFEFRMLEKTGEMPLGLKYIAWKKGPVPINLYEQKDSNQSLLFKFESIDEKKYLVKSLKTPDLDYFSVNEIKVMRDLIFIFAQPWVNTGVMSDSSHEKIRAWKVAWAERENSIIDVSKTFENLNTKTEDELSDAEEHFLTNLSIHKAAHSACS